jgi:hypothetical protein
MDVLFYTKSLREQYPNDVILFQQMARVGRTDNLEGGVVKVTYAVEIGNFATLDMTEDVPRDYVRAAREVQWYALWKRKGFNTNLWGYSFAVLFFLLFIK